jgi:predicted nucleic acid-binding protein
MATVVADTSALYALAFEDDRYHSLAIATYSRLLEEQHDLWLTSYVLVELGALIQRRLGFEHLMTLYESIGAAFQTLWVDRDMHTEAWSALAGREGRGLSLVDWTVFLAARHLNASVFTFDSDFAAEGATIISGDGLS